MCLGFFSDSFCLYLFIFFSIFYNSLLRVLNKMFSLGRVRKTESHIWRNRKLLAKTYCLMNKHI